ncbi:MAG: GMP synthase [Acidobacteriota bacterium]
MIEPHILILRGGHTVPEVLRDHGDYDRWFTDRMDGLGCRFSVTHLPDGGLPELDGYDGILVTGSVSSVLEPADWMGPLGELIVRTAAQGPPTLAVCFGAQMAAAALGGRVERNPLGWEIGTIGIDLTPEGLKDPLFSGLSARVEIQAVHEDSVTALPPGATLLAGSVKAPVQAFSAGPKLRAVQFHPEASAGIIQQLVNLRRERLEEDALAHGALDRPAARAIVSGIATGIRDTPDGRQVLANWVRHFL